MRRQALLPPTPLPVPAAAAAPYRAASDAPGRCHASASKSASAAAAAAAAAPRLRGAAPAIATTFVAFAVTAVVAVLGGVPPRELARLRLPPAFATGRVAAAATDGRGAASYLPPPWGTRPAVGDGGDTRCYLVGPHTEPPAGSAAGGPNFGSPMDTVRWLWANQSRAYCVAGPVCLGSRADGSSTAASLTLFSASVSCHSVDAAGRPVRPARAPRVAAAGGDTGGGGAAGDGGRPGGGTGTDDGGGSGGDGWVDPLADAGACAELRNRHVWRKYVGKDGHVAAVDDAAAWRPAFAAARSSPSEDPPARWHDGLTVLMPYYSHSEKNLCHWLRGWVMVVHALHHLAQYVPAESAAAAAVAAAVRAAAVAAGGVTAPEPPAAAPAADPNDGDAVDSRPFPAAAIYFLGHAVFDSGWNRGVLRASLAAVAAAGGPRTVTVANAHPGREGGTDCFRRAVLPGDDGAMTDAHTFVSDAPVYAAAVAAADAHVPAVPREALALREAVYAAAGVAPQVHPADTVRVHPPAVAAGPTAAAAAGLPAWPAAWDPAVSGAPPRPHAPAWPSSRGARPHPWATVSDLFSSAASASSRLPAALARGAPAADDTLRLAVPPRSILVLARPAGSKRRLDDESAAAFSTILRDLARQRGLTLLTVALDRHASLDDQVGAARRAGLVVGLHGANLVNAAFVPAGGALVELIPHSYRWTGWYEAGGNAGLRYAAVSTSPAGAALACVAAGRACIDNDVRDRELALDAAARRMLWARLGRAVDYLDALWAACPDGWMTVRGEGAVYRLPDLAGVGDG